MVANSPYQQIVVSTLCTTVGAGPDVKSRICIPNAAIDMLRLKKGCNDTETILILDYNNVVKCNFFGWKESSSFFKEAG